jgi:hypothetical protein
VRFGQAHGNVFVAVEGVAVQTLPCVDARQSLCRANKGLCRANCRTAMNCFPVVRPREAEVLCDEELSALTFFGDNFIITKKERTRGYWHGKTRKRRLFPDVLFAGGGIKIEKISRVRFMQGKVRMIRISFTKRVV